jgi:signal transduction histidine kinase/DNA-binding response OmpR family regulator/serine phosphatase RsbU (regulator of sigma subunit)/anti-sigma regulatory factor (Ser/Thr protein kinase)
MRRFLQAGGELGHDLLAVDWDATPLGDPDTWPYALRNSVRILLTSKFAMWMAWGPELTFICNDAYRRDTLGTKYPWALGKPASEVWSEIWGDIESRIQTVMETGEATWDESLRLFLERSGYLEETYHTFSYSPLIDDDNQIQGLLCVVKEDTQEVIAARRMATLGELGTRSSDLDEAETIASACHHLAANPWSLPFTLTYLFEDDGRSARLAGTTGFAGGHPAAPELMAVDDPQAVWPVGELVAGAPTVVVGDLRSRFTSLPTGEWSDPPDDGVLVPLLQPGQPVPYGFLVVGANPYRPLDERYLSFMRLIAGHLAGAITDARAFEFERTRAETLAELDRAKTDFFTNLSHEFRTPLTLLLGPAEDALADGTWPLPTAQRQRVELVHRNGQRLLTLVNSLLDFSRLASGEATARFEPVDLARSTSELVSMFASAAERAGLSLTIDCPELSEPVHVDQEHWAKIVLNLVSNALKYTFDGGINVRLAEEAGNAVLTVTDTGTGIPSDELPHLFQRFHRVHGARSRTFEGSGIGLALVSELAALHGGTVSAHSVPDVGSTFTVRMPMGTAHLPHPSRDAEERADSADARSHALVTDALRWVDEATPPDPPAPAPGDAGRVLVVEDNADMRDYIAGLLSDEYVVATATDGMDALEKLPDFRPDLVLTDVMMPRLDGFGLLERLHDNARTTGIPVIMLSARAGSEGTVEGLEAGADDYLGKPFSARELKARVRVNMELDRNRRLRETLQRSETLLDQAQRLAKVASWEVDLATDRVTASAELWRILERTQEDFDRHGFSGMVEELVVPADRPIVAEAFGTARPGALLEYDVRISPSAGVERLVRVRGEVVEEEHGSPRRIRGSVQDITEQRRAEHALASASAYREAASREHAIADELQRSLLPEQSFDLEHLDVATYYRAGVQGTQVGGDWYDIIELGAGRSALVVGDVMGRGVSAAAGMGQLRSAVRAFAKMDLPPSEILEYLDGMVADLSGDQIVTCVYAVFDSTDQTLRYANAGHLPLLLTRPGQGTEKLGAAGPPLGAGFFGQPTEKVELSPGCTVAFYTDGLVERRERDIDAGIEALAEQLEMHSATDLEGMPETLVGALLPDGPDDDIAILIARVNQEPFTAAVHHRLGLDEPAVSNARRVVSETLREWEVPSDTIDEVVLMASELVTNAFLHGRPPIDLRLRVNRGEVTFEVQDRAPYRPRRRRARDDDENGRGLQIVSILADRWGSRATGTGKSVWCTVAFSSDDESSLGPMAGQS